MSIPVSVSLSILVSVAMVTLADRIQNSQNWTAIIITRQGCEIRSHDILHNLKWLKLGYR